MLFKRFRPFVVKAREAGAPDDGSLEMRISTDEPVSQGDWSEVLSHDAGAVDCSSLRALLINHDPDQIAGPLNGEPRFDGHAADISANILPDARMGSGVSVRDAVRSGALRGVSVSYAYDMRDTEWDEASRTLRVNRWSAREASLTPIPADLGASVRTLPTGLIPKIRTKAMTEPALPAPAPKPEDAQVTAERVTALRAEAKNIAKMATSLGLSADDFVGLPLAEAQLLMIQARAAKDLAGKPDPTQPITAPVRVTADVLDKQRDALITAYTAKVFSERKDLGDNPYRGRSMIDMARQFAAAQRVPGCERWSKRDLAHFVLGEHSQIEGLRDAANIINATFPNFVTLNAITKIVAKGYEMSDSAITYQRVVTMQTVPDFKNYYIGGLATANLQLTPENVAFPELMKSEGVYNDTVKMWGGTLSLTLQALINDDTAQFDRSLRQAGVIAQKTVDQRVYQKLLCGTSAVTTASTWTNNTTSGCSPVYTTADTLAAARQKMNNGMIALMTKKGADQNPNGRTTKYIVAGPTSGSYLMGLLGAAGGGQTVGNSYATGQELVITPWLEASTLTGNSTTSFYVLANPAEVTGLVLSEIIGYESVQVQEFDAGAVGARKWKLWKPFEADLFFETPNYAGATATVFAAQQCTT